MTLQIDGRTVEFEAGETVLSAAGRAGIEIPHLCALADAPCRPASCRMCVVELEGAPKLQTSCTLEARDGMVVRTHTPRVLAVRRNLVELMIAGHPQECLSCARQRTCELSRLAGELGVRDRRYKGALRKHPLDVSSCAIERDPNKCILCGRCVALCHTVQGVGAIDFAGRGFQTRVAPAFHAGLNTSDCILCGQCTRACPTGALVEKSHLDGVLAALADPDADVVVQIAPAVPATLAGTMGASTVEDALGRLSAALSSIGFDAIYDTSFAADLTVMEEVNELIGRIRGGGVLPMFTSCSPAWVHWVELHRPSLIPHLSTCKSPQQMAAALIRRRAAEERSAGAGRRLVLVSIMPCTAKKHEAREHGDVDYVLTTRELERLIARFGLDLRTLRETRPLDAPLSRASGAGRLFGGTGGVMEAAIRTAHRLLAGRDLERGPKLVEARGLEGFRGFELQVAGAELRFGIASGLGRAQDFLARLGDGQPPFHFIEVMTCPGGCVAGGGQPYDTDFEAVRDRLARLHDADRKAAERYSDDNPDVVRLMDALTAHERHTLLHRTYVDRRAEARAAALAAE